MKSEAMRLKWMGSIYFWIAFSCKSTKHGNMWCYQPFVVKKNVIKFLLFDKSQCHVISPLAHFLSLTHNNPSLLACRQNYYKMKLAMNARHEQQNPKKWGHFSAQVENQSTFIYCFTFSLLKSMWCHMMQCKRCDAFHCSGNGKCTQLCAVSTNATATATNQNDIFFVRN